MYSPLKFRKQVESVVARKLTTLFCDFTKFRVKIEFVKRCAMRFTPGDCDHDLGYTLMFVTSCDLLKQMLIKNLMKFIYLIKALGTFGITLYWWMLSYVYPGKTIEYKRRWARSVMSYIGYEMAHKGEFAEHGPRIYVGNHVSYLDILLLMAINPNIAFLAKKEVRNWPIIGIGAVRIGTLFVDRESKQDRERVRSQLGEQLINNKSQIVIFPSGTTSLREEKIWKKGIFEIAQHYQIPVQLFKIDYDPYRESSYVDDDTLIGKMVQQFSLPFKKACVTWLETIQVRLPEADAEKLRQQVTRD